MILFELPCAKYREIYHYRIHHGCRQYYYGKKLTSENYLQNIVEALKDQIKKTLFRKIIVVLHGFHNKSQKTPKKEIALAERLKKEYYEQK